VKRSETRGKNKRMIMVLAHVFAASQANTVSKPNISIANILHNSVIGSTISIQTCRCGYLLSNKYSSITAFLYGAWNPALYVRAFDNGKSFEWFGALEKRELNLLFQLAIIINEKYIRRHKKYSEQIMLLEIRERLIH